MGENKEAIRNYKQCIQTLSNIESYHAALICIYPFYCGALADEKLYGDLKDATERCQQIRHIYKEKLGVSEECLSKSPNYVYFCLVRAIVLIEEHRVSEALKILSGAERITRNRSDYVRRDVLYRMAELYINEGDYQKALHYNSMADSCRSLLLHYMGDQLRVVRQRADIYFRMGNFEKTAVILRSVMDSVDERNLIETRNQLNELNAHYQIDRLRQEQQQDKEHTIYAFFTLVIVCMLLLVAVVVFFMHRIHKKNAQLLVALDRSKESTRMKDSFVKHISHELRTPLHIITGFSQVMANPDYSLSTEARKDVVKRITDNTQLITSLINELLELSDEESRHNYAPDDEINVKRVCDEMIRQLEQADKGRLQVYYRIDVDDDFMIHNNLVGLKKILWHLGNNSLKFTENGSVGCHTKLSTDKKWVEFHMSDTGIGIPEELRERIFEKFYKIDPFKKGLGLGLSVARHIAEQMGGTLAFDREYEGPGTCFVLSLPNK